MTGELSLYDRARQALGEALRVDEAKAIRDDAARLEFVAKQAKDNDLLADATELKLRAERRLGELIGSAKADGHIREGRPGKARNGSAEEPFPPVRLKDIGIDKKLSSKAQRLADVDLMRFDALVEQTRNKILGGKAVVVNPIKDLTTSEKALQRRIREAQLAARQKALPEKRYGVILADPEWAFEVWSEKGLDRAADNHYPTSSFETLAARDVPSIAAGDCVLFLWVTAPHHAAGNGARLMRAWGFEPKAEWIWNKVEAGTGYWNRNVHEVLLVGTRGAIPAPAPGTQRPSIMTERATDHSTKPQWAYAMIEEFYPNLMKIELNARVLRAGWDAWGFEAPETESVAANPQGDAADGAGDGSRLTSTPSPADPSSAPRSGQEADRLGDPSPPSLVLQSQGGGAGEPIADQSSLAPPGSPEPLSAPRSGEGANRLAGPMTRQRAEPILRERYATTDGQALADELGITLGTLRGWAFKLGLTSKARASANGRAQARNLVVPVAAEASP